MKGFRLPDKLKTNNLSGYVRLIVSVSTVITTIAIASLISFHEIITFKQIIKEHKETYLTEQKDFIKDIVDNEIDYIESQKKQFDDEVKKRFENNVQRAYELAESLYNKYQRELTPDQLKKLIIQSVSSLTVQNDFAKVYISTLSGKGIFYSGKPEMWGKNLINLTDINGHKVVQNEIDFLQNHNEGYINYPPVEKTDSNTIHKVAFIKKFAPYNWYFGSKGYLEDYLDEFKQNIAERVSSVRFRHGGYIFVNETNGDPVVYNGEIYAGSYNFFDGSDPRKQEVFEQEMEAANSSFPDGGYFIYEWERIGSDSPSPKVSYAKLYKPNSWVIGAGFYHDEIDDMLLSYKTNLLKALLKDLLQVLIFLILILSAQFYIIYRFNKKYEDEFSHFNRFFKEGKKNFKTLNTSKLHFQEFRQMGDFANEMIKEQETTHKKLIKEQKKAMESDRLKTAFLANMSHEIRTPMNAIIGFSELMADPSITCDAKKEFTKIVIENGQHLLELIDDIIDISKIESDQLKIFKRKFRLDSLVDTIEKQFKEQLCKQSNIRFHVETSLPTNCLLYSDELRIKQVLTNLIGNAIKFTPQGTIKLNVSKNHSKILFDVSDTGIGISKKDQEKIFERFIQADGGLKKNYGGTGLGLAISKNIINLLGGEIGVESKPGKGSKFFFHIPM